MKNLGFTLMTFSLLVLIGCGGDKSASSSPKNGPENSGQTQSQTQSINPSSLTPEELATKAFDDLNNMKNEEQEQAKSLLSQGKFFELVKFFESKSPLFAAHYKAELERIKSIKTFEDLVRTVETVWSQYLKSGHPVSTTYMTSQLALTKVIYLMYFKLSDKTVAKLSDSEKNQKANVDFLYKIYGLMYEKGMSSQFDESNNILLQMNKNQGEIDKEIYDAAKNKRKEDTAKIQSLSNDNADLQKTLDKLTADL